MPLNIVVRSVLVGGILGIGFPGIAQAQLGGVLDRAIQQGARNLRRDLDPFRRDLAEPPVDNTQPRSLTVPGESGRQSGGEQFIDPGFGQPFQNRTPRNNPPRNNPTYDQRYYDRNPTYGEPPAVREEYSNLPMTISCPKAEEDSCDYTLISPRQAFPYTIRPGYRQSLKENTAWMIRYESGSDTHSYRLRGGNEYSLRKNGEGNWQLYKLPQPTDDEPPVLGD